MAFRRPPLQPERECNFCRNPIQLGTPRYHSDCCRTAYHLHCIGHFKNWMLCKVCRSQIGGFHFGGDSPPSSEVGDDSDERSSKSSKSTTDDSSSSSDGGHGNGGQGGVGGGAQGGQGNGSTQFNMDG